MRPQARRCLRLALLACAGFLLSTIFSTIYETALWPAGLAAAFAVGMALAVRAARPGVHPGLHGFLRPLPADGLALIERERTLHRNGAPRAWWLWRVAPAMPIMMLLLDGHAQAAHWPVWVLLVGAMAAPALLVPYRRAWIGSFSLLLIAGALGWHAVDLRARLPAGRWTTLWTGARCGAQIVLADAGAAWCIDTDSRRVFHFQLSTGLALEQYPVENAWEVFAVDGDDAWIKPSTNKGLVRLGDGRMRTHAQPFFFPIVGAVAADNSLWFVNGMRELWVYSGGDAATLLTTADGLLNDTAVVVAALPDETVWVGSRSGLSRLDPFSGTWQTYPFLANGFRGAITDIAFGPDGAIWLLQRETFNALNQTDWWLSILRPNADWLHVNMAEIVGLQAPPGRDALAVDGLGRGWFTAMSYARGEQYLGVLNADGTLAHPVALVGRDRSAVPYRTGARRPAGHGVLADGGGGIYVYSGANEPLRHWTP